jgi:hypothetical protein
MERGHEFTINLRGAGTYVIRLLEGVQIEMAEGRTIGRWPACDLEAKGDHRVIGFGGEAKLVAEPEPHLA